MSDTQTSRHPRNPWVSFLFAAFFVLAGAASVYIFLALGEEALGGEMVGRRTEFFVLAGPFLFLALAIVSIVRGARAFAPWTAYRASTSPSQWQVDRDRDVGGGNPVMPLVLGVLATAGFGLFLAGFVGWSLRGFEDVQSAVFIFEFMMICLILAVAGLGRGAMILGSRRRLQQ